MNLLTKWQMWRDGCKAVFPFAQRKVYDAPMYIVAGLGNPGAAYANQRHNIGFMVIDALADALSAPPFQKKFSGKVALVQHHGQRVVLLKPETFMNESGRSIQAAAAFYKLTPQQVIVVHDELDLQLSDVRRKVGGGHAGHNGLKSVQAHIGTADFKRVRVGIGHPGDKTLVSGYVLSDFAKSDQQMVATAIQAAVDIILADITKI